MYWCSLDVLSLMLKKNKMVHRQLFPTLGSSQVRLRTDNNDIKKECLGEQPEGSVSYVYSWGKVMRS